MNRIATKLPEGRRQAHRRRPIWLLLALLTLGPAVVFAQTWTTIDCPDALATYARNINERGEIVGICEDATGEHGFLLRRGRFTMIDVPGAAEGTTAAFGINNRGDVVGRYIDERRRRSRVSAPARPLYDDRSCRARSSTVARGIDDLGRIVGFYAGSDDAFHGFILDSSGYRDIDFPGADSTAAFDINALKQIVGGYIDTSGIPHGYLLKKGDFTSIDHPDAAGTRAFGINILGQIVGGWTDDPECPDCFTKAFLLTLARVREPGVPWSARDCGQRHQRRGQDRGRVLRRGRSLPRIPAQRPRRGRLRRRLNRQVRWAGRSDSGAPLSLFPSLPPVRARVREDEPALVGEVRVGVEPPVGRDAEPRPRGGSRTARKPVRSGGASCFQRSLAARREIETVEGQRLFLVTQCVDRLAVGAPLNEGRRLRERRESAGRAPRRLPEEARPASSPTTAKRASVRRNERPDTCLRGRSASGDLPRHPGRRCDVSDLSSALYMIRRPSGKKTRPPIEETAALEAAAARPPRSEAERDGFREPSEPRAPMPVGRKRKRPAVSQPRRVRAVGGAQVRREDLLLPSRDCSLLHRGGAASRRRRGRRRRNARARRGCVPRARPGRARE